METTKKQLTNLNKFRTCGRVEDQHVYIAGGYFTAFSLGGKKFGGSVYYRLAHRSENVSGPAAVPVADFVKIAKKQTIEAIGSTGKQRAKITTSSGEFELGGGDLELIKQAPDILDFTGLSIEAETLKSLKKYCSTDDLRPAMQGVFIDAEDQKMVATNGHRLKWQEIDAPGIDSLIIPADIIALLSESSYKLHNCAQWTGPRTGKMFALVGDTETVFFNEINEKYPNWQSVVPRESDTEQTFTLNIKEALKACQAAQVVANSESGIIRLVPSGEAVILRAEDIDTSQEYKSKPIGSFEAVEPFEVGYNIEYLEATLKDQKSAETLELKITGKNRAARFNGTGLLMPVMLNTYA